MTTPKLDRYTLERAAEICKEHARSYGAIQPERTQDQRFQDYAAERALLTAADAILALRDALPKEPELFRGAKFGPVLNEDGTITPARLAQEPASEEKVPEDVQRDAARYRWLRNITNQGAKLPYGSWPLVVSDRPSLSPRYIGPLFGDALDATVDAAMLAAAPPSGEEKNP